MEASKKVLANLKRLTKKLTPSSPSRGEDRYDLREVLGQGKYGIVQRCIDKKTGGEYAIKVINKENLTIGEKTAVYREIELMRAHGNHPSIVGIKDIFENTRKLHIVMELMKGGDLLQLMKKRKGRFTEKEAAILIRPVLNGIQHLHAHQIAHRDIKPENLLFQTDADSQLKIADFGFAKQLEEDGHLGTPCGTALYCAPEVAREENYDTKVDIWSLGVILYILLCGYPPFYQENCEKLFEEVAKGKVEFGGRNWVTVSDSAKDLVSRMLRYEPHERISAEDAIRHPFIQTNSSEPQQLSTLNNSGNHTNSSLPFIQKSSSADVANLDKSNSKDKFQLQPPEANSLWKQRKSKLNILSRKSSKSLSIAPRIDSAKKEESENSSHTNNNSSASTNNKKKSRKSKKAKKKRKGQRRHTTNCSKEG